MSCKAIRKQLLFFLRLVTNNIYSVTALRANFWHVPGLDGPLHLDQ
jgi:hypothetical protein